MRGVGWKQQQWEMNRIHHGNSSKKNKFRNRKSQGRASAQPGKSSKNFSSDGRKKFSKARSKTNNMGNKRGKNSNRNAKRK